MAKHRTMYIGSAGALAAVAATASLVALSSAAQGTKGVAPAKAQKVSTQPSRRHRTATQPSGTGVADRAFAVLRRPAAHLSDAGGPSGVVAVTEGSFTARVSQEANGEVCLAAVSATETSGMTCDHAQAAAEHGIILFTEGVGHPDRITVLVPDDVRSVTATAEAAETVIPTTNNVATATLKGFQSVAFTAPDGARITYSAPPTHTRRAE